MSTSTKPSQGPLQDALCDDSVWDANQWTLASDAWLLKSLAQSTDALRGSASKALDLLDRLERKLGDAELRAREVQAELAALANSQFVESKVVEGVDWTQVVGLRPRYTQGTALPPPTPTRRDPALSGDEEDADDDDAHRELMTRVYDSVLAVDPLNERPLPHIIGSELFTSDSTLGLTTRGTLDEDDSSVISSPARPPPQHPTSAVEHQQQNLLPESKNLFSTTSFLATSLPLPTDELFDQGAAYNSAFFTVFKEPQLTLGQGSTNSTPFGSSSDAVTGRPKADLPPISKLPSAPNVFAPQPQPSLPPPPPRRTVPMPLLRAPLVTPISPPSTKVVKLPEHRNDEDDDDNDDDDLFGATATPFAAMSVGARNQVEPLTNAPPIPSRNSLVSSSQINDKSSLPLNSSSVLQAVAAHPDQLSTSHVPSASSQTDTVQQLSSTAIIPTTTHEPLPAKTQLGRGLFDASAEDQSEDDDGLRWQ